MSSDGNNIEGPLYISFLYRLCSVVSVYSYVTYEINVSLLTNSFGRVQTTRLSHQANAAEQRETPIHGTQSTLSARMRMMSSHWHFRPDKPVVRNTGKAVYEDPSWPTKPQA
jgi:hypothetical protein